MKNTQRRFGGKAGIALVAVVLAATALAGGALAAMAAHKATKTVTVKVTEKNYRIVLAKHSFAKGKVTFVVKNASNTAHEFKITGPGLSKSIPGLIAPGKTKQLTVTLKKGTYSLICPLHVALGMKTSIKVGGGTAGSTGGTGGTTTTGGSSWG
ncbi:MAG TPA: cupredoxin domain-containing protein [Gaiellaceae bacterium]|nr:cupredoxin domain-containing protein [Gaiellaceae bacterium]